MAEFIEAESIEVTLDEVMAARERALQRLGLTWDELAERIVAHDYTHHERRVWLTYKGVDLAVQDGLVRHG